MWDPQDAEWEAKYDLLVAYADARGDSLVPYRYITADNVALGDWVSMQRKAYQAGTLSAARATRPPAEPPRRGF